MALGYLRRPEATGECFVSDSDKDPGTRLYRTGDLVRWTADGTLVFVGRSDDQVKIRGFRVEPEETTQVLDGLDGVRRAVVAGLRRGNGEAYLAAYVEPSAPVGPGEEERRTFAARLTGELAARLPDYLVPRAWRIVDALPLNANGKLDRSRLPDPDLVTAVPTAPHTDGTDGAARNAPSAPAPGDNDRADVGRRLRELWAEEFGIDPRRIGPDDSFFDLGGHSITAMRLVNRVREELGAEYPMLGFYQEPTLRAMTDRLSGAAGPSAAVRGGPATEQQTRFAQLHAAHASPQVFNVALRIDLSGKLDVDALGAALNALVDRHESLRTRLVRDGDDGGADAAGSWRQEVLEPRPVDLVVEDLTGLPEPGRRDAVRSAATAATETPLYPFEGDVFRLRLLRTDEEEWTLLLVLHHCVCDGWAVSILLRELAALYGAARAGAGHNLPSDPPQQVEYAHWQIEQDGREVARKTDYWLRELDGAPFTSGLPTDRPRTGTLSGRGGTVAFTVPANVRAAVEQLAKQHATTPFVVTAAALGRLLARKSGQSDVLMNISYANRERRAFEALVACLATGFALRVRDAADGDFASLTDRVARTALLGMDHAMPPRRVAPAMRERTGVEIPSGLPVGFAYQSSLETDVDLPGLTTSVQDIAADAARTELIVVLTPTRDVLEGVVEYSADLWDRWTVETWAEEYVSLLREEVGEALDA
nr:condensation domain-containing protein [Streptomyces sp. NTH33]